MPDDTQHLQIVPPQTERLDGAEGDLAIEDADQSPDAELEVVEDLNDDEVPLEEDDDNPYQDSDAALPDDEEEAAIGDRLRQLGEG